MAELENAADVLAEMLASDPDVSPERLGQMRSYLEEKATLEEWNRHYEELINAPDADCPGCGVSPCQVHREGCPEFERIKAENG